jgi:hypothetical protein
MEIHGILEFMVPNLDGCFTFRFWKPLQETLDSELEFSIVYHPSYSCTADKEFSDSRICRDYLQCGVRKVGMSVYHVWSLHATIVFILALG